MSETTGVTDDANRITRDVRGTTMHLMGGNRSLELCSQMNYETEVLDLIDTQEKGTIFYDLGACEGRFGIYAALKGLRVYAFEPDQDNYAYLLKNKALNNLSDDQLQPFNVALGEADGEGTLKIGQPWPGGHQKVIDNKYERSDLDFDFKKTAKINIISLDSFLDKKRADPPQCLKIDIDGSERSFMQGAPNTLALPGLHTLIIELETDDPNFGWITSQLETSGFQKTDQYQIPNEPKLFNFVYRRV